VKITPENILYHEIIGLKAKVYFYPDPTLRGLEGIIVWETRNTIEIEYSRGVVKLFKKGLVLDIEVPDYGWIRVRGELLTGRPTDRAKRMLRGR